MMFQKETEKQGLSLKNVEKIVDETIKFFTEKQRSFLESSEVSIPLFVKGLWRISGTSQNISVLKDRICAEQTLVELNPSAHEVLSVFKEALRAFTSYVSFDQAMGALLKSSVEGDWNKIMHDFMVAFVKDKHEVEAKILHQAFYLAHKTQENSMENQMTAKNIGIILGPWLLSMGHIPVESQLQNITLANSIAAHFSSHKMFEKPFSVRSYLEKGSFIFRARLYFIESCKMLLLNLITCVGYTDPFRWIGKILQRVSRAPKVGLRDNVDVQHGIIENLSGIIKEENSVLKKASKKQRMKTLLFRVNQKLTGNKEGSTIIARDHKLFRKRA